MTTENNSEKQESTDVTELNKAKNETVTTELHFDLLKQYAWFSSAVIGALIILIQLKVIEIGQDVYISIGLLSLSIIFSLTGQDYLVDSLLKGKSIYQMSKMLKFFRGLSMGCLGFGSGYFFAGIFL
ncbi:hypothetical protein [Thalassotalea marina]|uniref:Uncharacterized protein n=1 Tax=Thalassotalea marina TaxID=1673741 RepID=A0A919ENF2_9GAMM|nr:hypothetical protein [Thalassotalea marina]GHG01489.1 hypothetical protein GCM10017161_32760 [Thalassotalea marina]